MIALLLLFMMAAPTPEALELASREARAELAQRNYAKALGDADSVYAQARLSLKKRSLDKEPHLPLALGAAIEVHAQAMAAQGQRGEAVAYLRAELKTFARTSIVTRIQKNILLLSLEGKAAPPLAMTRLFGPKPGTMQGHAVLLFFWAHWCGDCKGEEAALEQLRATFPALTIIGPTQRYGYVEGGVDAPAAKETAYIEEVRKKFYPALSATVSEENFRAWGASTTPTIALIDKAGIVRMYHPGAMPFDELAVQIRKLR